jgi:hypothetical protein
MRVNRTGFKMIEGARLLKRSQYKGTLTKQHKTKTAAFRRS